MDIDERMRAMTRDWVVKAGPTSPRSLANTDYMALASCLEQDDAFGAVRNLTSGWIVQRARGAWPSPLTDEELAHLASLSSLPEADVPPASSDSPTPTDGAPDRERFAAAYRHLEDSL